MDIVWIIVSEMEKDLCKELFFLCGIFFVEWEWVFMYVLRESRSLLFLRNLIFYLFWI